MTELTLAEKKAQFNEFFSIEHEIHVNAVPVEENFELPEIEELDMFMPYAFRMASELALVETKALRPLRLVGDHAVELANYLNQLSKKIDLMMSYVLHQQDHEDHRYCAKKFGGGGIVLQSDTTFNIGDTYQLKIFIEDEATAVFCFGEVIELNQTDENYEATFIFSRIREQDQEMLVKASLHLQTKHLKKRSQHQP